MQPVNSQPKRGRPRSLSTRDAILRAAADLMAEGGLGAVTIEATARRARVGKPTIYRYWPGREALAMAALLADGAPSTGLPPNGTALEDLSTHLARTATAFTTPRGRNAALMVASADPDSELAKAFRTQVMLASREEGRALLHRAEAEGSIRPGLDLDLALDALYGPLFYRLLVGHQPLTEAFATTLVALLVQGITPAAQPGPCPTTPTTQTPADRAL